jgi:predicted transcriptional regulator
MHTIENICYAHCIEHECTRMELSIKAAAELAKVSRTTIYKKIESGELSRKDNGTVDTVDVLRVFSGTSPVHRLHHKKAQVEHVEQVQNDQKNTPAEPSQVELLYKAQIRLLEDSLRKSEVREDWLQKQISTLTDTMKLLEAPKSPFTTPPNLPEAEKRGFFGFRKKTT